MYIFPLHFWQDFFFPKWEFKKKILSFSTLFLYIPWLRPLDLLKIFELSTIFNPKLPYYHHANGSVKNYWIYVSRWNGRVCTDTMFKPQPVQTDDSIINSVENGAGNFKIYKYVILKTILSFFTLFSYLPWTKSDNEKILKSKIIADILRT